MRIWLALMSSKIFIVMHILKICNFRCSHIRVKSEKKDCGLVVVMWISYSYKYLALLKYAENVEKGNLKREN
jgi:hypothetical protein